MVLGMGKFPPLPILSFFFFFFPILSPCCWTNNEIDVRQINGRKRNKF